MTELVADRLPSYMTRFIGREREIAELEAMLVPSGLVNICGDRAGNRNAPPVGRRAARCTRSCVGRCAGAVGDRQLRAHRRPVREARERAASRLPAPEGTRDEPDATRGGRRADLCSGQPHGELGQTDATELFIDRAVVLAASYAFTPANAE
jgi:hypothetical protein